VLFNQGWRRDSLKVGDQVTAEGSKSISAPIPTGW
jgi:hypothetical protein